MISRTTKLRWRRKFKRRVNQVEDISQQAEAQLERHFFRRLVRLFEVRRFVLGWVLLVGLLICGSIVQTLGLSSYYQSLEPAPGGTLTEGIVGTYRTSNPLYATSSVDSAVSNLLFAGLMKYDKNNELVGDLAENLKVDDNGLVYTVTLRPDLKWHDGQNLTSADVAYTYQTIQNPDARSPLLSSWKGIKIATPDEQTVVFTLPSTLSSFPHSLVTGIIPRHVLDSVSPEQLRTNPFNTIKPVGSGPFKFDAIEVVGADQETREERIGLIPNENYHQSPPKLRRFVVRTFRTEKLMIDSYKEGELSSMAGLDNLPDDISGLSEVRDYSIPLTGATMVFFKTSAPPLNDQKVRQALVRAANINKIIENLDYPAVRVNGPFLTSHFSYDKKRTQLKYDQKTSQKLLDEAGWKLGADGIRQKSKKPLTFKLYAESNSEYAMVTKELQAAWREIGVDVEVLLQEPSDIQGVVSRHDYDAILYGISLGTDPDMFPYWHSSQISAQSNRLNLSEYKSSAADTALEAGRTRGDAKIRKVKYQPFLEAWRKDAPALALYQPRFLYVTRGEIHNFEPKTMNSTTDRFTNVHNWMIRREKVLKDEN